MAISFSMPPHSADVGDHLGDIRRVVGRHLVRVGQLGNAGVEMAEALDDVVQLLPVEFLLLQASPRASSTLAFSSSAMGLGVVDAVLSFLLTPLYIARAISLQEG